jgi:hypothetical protein
MGFTPLGDGYGLVFLPVGDYMGKILHPAGTWVRKRSIVTRTR